jgi:hypothetical protein
VRSAGRLAAALRRLQEQRAARISSITAAAAPADAVLAQAAAAEEAFFDAPRRQTRSQAAMGERPLGFEGPPLVKVAFDDRYGCLDLVRGCRGRWTTRHFWFADGTHQKTVLLSSVYVQRPGAVPPTPPDVHFYEDIAPLRPAVYPDDLRRGVIVWVHFGEQLDGVVLWWDRYYMGTVVRLVWEHPAEE